MRSILKLVLPLVAASVLMVAQNPSNEVCAGCHDQSKKLSGSTHASLACSQCHSKHEEYPHPTGIEKPKCGSCHTKANEDYTRGVHGQAAAHGNAAAPECATCHGAAHEVLNPQSVDFRKAVPDTCGMCHSEISDQYKTSIHGKAIARGEMSAAVCTDCHGEHAILSKSNANSPVVGRNVRDTCGQCHGNVTLARRFGIPSDRLTTFDSSFHGLAAASGSQTVANCSSCHGIHNILPSSDAKSTVSTKNLPSTCGKCHPGAGERFALGPIHQADGKQEPVAAGWVRSFYVFAIPFTIGLMLLHNLGDWVRKLARFYRGGPASRAVTPSDEVRMYPYERLSHALLATSFIVLAWTGLALKFPDQWWARPLQFLEPQIQFRRNIHRIAAVVMILVAMMHATSIIFSRRLRHHWFEMIPKFSDATDALRAFAYNLGLRKERPKLPAHGYIEKAEYWAVVWGTMVMVVTGILLWANNLSLKWLPKAVLDVATAVHWYEAVLATLAIVVWHFYSVIFDPDVYPMDTAWFNGKSPRRREGDPEAGAEPETTEPEQPAERRPLEIVQK